MATLNNIHPENHIYLEETNLPTPIYQGRTVNLLEGNGSSWGSGGLEHDFYIPQ